jgi:hypothetical protein
VIARQGFDRVAQQGGEMAGKRRHHQHLGLGGRDIVLGEAQQIAERQ